MDIFTFIYVMDYPKYKGLLRYIIQTTKLSKTSKFSIPSQHNELTIITVTAIVRRETPPKNEAAPMRAKAPGSIQPQKLPG